MESIAEFNDNHGFNVKLTNEKIFIDAAGSSETIALRGLNGVGLYDDIKKYNDQLEAYKKTGKTKNFQKWMGIVIGGGSLIAGLNLGEFGTVNVIFGILLIILGIYIGSRGSKDSEPVLDSYFRLMLSGGDRKFPFHKSDETSVKIADFINKIEDTLTAYR